MGVRDSDGRTAVRDRAGDWGSPLKSPLDLAELLNRANALFQRGMLADAEQLYRQIVETSPDQIVALNNRGVALERLDRMDEALASIDSALAIRPDYADAHYNRGIVLLRMRRFDEALASYDQALAIRPDYAEALSNRGIAMMELHRLDDALASFDAALAIKADYAEACYNRGIVLMRLERANEALSSFDSALAIRSDYAAASFNRGVALQGLKRHQEALATFDRILAADPDHPHALSALATSALETCDWTLTEDISRRLKRRIVDQQGFIAPFVLLFYSDDPSLQLACAKNFVRHTIAALPRLPQRPAGRHEKIRIAYLSADFRNHPMSQLMAELFGLHDRARFEVIGISFGPDDRSEIRARVAAAFDQFYDLRAESDRDIAALVSDLKIDIAIDLMGHTRNSRPGISAHRGAPIQVSYLGFPGTTGAGFIDYVIADAIVLPLDQQRFYTEEIVHLPETYWVNDSKLKISEQVPTRAEAGLPDRGFVFCCFNKGAKITAPVFEVWMRLLAAVDGSVLWLLRDNAVAESNLRKEAARRGIDPGRLVFAGKLALDRHLARHRLADLFLDTLPYNAHTTASDALAAGLPLVTCLGKTFSGRVAASLLSAAGLAELVTQSLVEYEALALKLAKDGEYLGDVRARLAQNRKNSPLFDTDRFRRHIEAAYVTMYERWQRGESSRVS
jgi:protein O-GlcNAc transferase